MKFTMSFDCDNAAFGDEEGAESRERLAEIERILQHLARRISRSHTSGPVVDENGNTVGSYRLGE